MIHQYRNGIIIPTQLNVDEGLYDKEAQLILTIKVQQTIRLMDEYKKGKIGHLMHKAYFNKVQQLRSEEYHIIEFTLEDESIGLQIQSHLAQQLGQYLIDGYTFELVSYHFTVEQLQDYQQRLVLLEDIYDKQEQMIEKQRKQQRDLYREIADMKALIEDTTPFRKIN